MHENEPLDVVAAQMLPTQDKEALLAAEAVPSEENAPYIRVVALRPPFQQQRRLVFVDVRRLIAA